MIARPVGRRTPPLAGALLAVALAAGTTSACSSTGGLPASGSPPPATTSATATASAPGTATPGSITLDEHAAGTTVHVRTGTALVVRLHSTYWSTPATSDPRVLAPVGNGTSSHSVTCRPGGGCGVSSARFTAQQPGTVHITASRSSCGEAMRCSPGQGRYDVTVAVTA